MAEEEELRIVATFDDRASQGLSALQNNMRQMGGGAAGAGMERTRRQTGEVADAMKNMSQQMSGAALTAGIVGGAVSALALKAIDAGVSFIGSATNFRGYADAMQNLARGAKATGESMAQFQANIDVFRLTGVSADEARQQMTAFADKQVELANRASPARQMIINLAKDKEDMRRFIDETIALPQTEAMERVREKSIEIYNETADYHYNIEREKNIRLGVGEEEASRRALAVSRQRGAEAQRDFTARWGAAALASADAFNQVSEAQKAMMEGRREDAERYRRASIQVETAWERITHNLSSAILNMTGLGAGMESVATWTSTIAERIAKWSDSIRAAQQTAAVQQAPWWRRGLAEKEEVALMEAEQRTPDIAAAARAGIEMGEIRPGEAARWIAEEERRQAEEPMTPEQRVAARGYQSTGRGAIRRRGAPQPTAVPAPAEEERPTVVEEPAEERPTVVEEPAAAVVARGYRSTGRGPIRRRGVPQPTAAEIPAVEGAQLAAAARAPAAPVVEDRVLTENTEEIGRLTPAVEGLTGAVQAMRSGLEMGREAAGEGVVGPPPVQETAEPIAAPQPTAVPAPAAAQPGLLSRAWGGIKSLWGGGQVETRQVGGPITGGQPYLVGERGPEIVVPDRGGEVTPTADIAAWEQGAPELGAGASGRAQQVVTDQQFARMLQTFMPGGSVSRLASGAMSATDIGGMITRLHEQMGGAQAAETAAMIQRDVMTGAQIGQMAMEAFRGAWGGGTQLASLDAGRGGETEGLAILDRAAQYLDRAAMANVNVNGTGKISVDVRAPPGTSVKAEGDGLFKSTEIVRQTQMLPSESGALPATGVSGGLGSLTNGMT